MANWATGLCDCTLDTNQCIDNCICFPCSISRQINAVENMVPDTFTVGKCLCPGILCCFANCMVRRKIVDRYHLDEGLIGSLIFGCLPCSVCQHHRELTKQGTWPGGSCLHSSPKFDYNAAS